MSDHPFVKTQKDVIELRPRLDLTQTLNTKEIFQFLLLSIESQKTLEIFQVSVTTQRIITQEYRWNVQSVSPVVIGINNLLL